MSSQRVISESTGLYKLSIVNKQKNSTGSEEEITEPTKPETPKKGLPLSSPVRKGSKLESSPTRGGKVESDEPGSFSESLLYELAAKRRQVVELKQQLQHAEKELETLEQKCKRIGQAEKTPGSPERLHEITAKLQDTWRGVNSSPTVLKSKQSISNFFNAKDQAFEAENPQPLPTNTKSSYSQMMASKLQNIRNQQTQSPFLKKLVSKWQDFSVNEAEEEEFDNGRPTDKYYIKSKLDYDDDEEISSESELEMDKASTATDLDGGPVVSTFKR
ncbi:Acf4p [Lachancea thermotolerans CBS 6340]|uniref:KLTH0F07744p n=1 Tax=Lachancea thermotolerans (strain ATCC 56472 / CBS 6340 / NRRL Y-8284) TaxID=559295 RepID=C5DKV1_LACTC|nr:KLTH0F07744p [Lachancea thermotolerans CBS 6340]CAR24102.1 KLTH0F07744p [Lachancea thermotolerans CBS 6340]